MAARRHRALPRAESEGKEVRVTARAATRLRAPVWLAQLVLPLLGLWLLRGGLALVMAVWAALSLLALPPFDAPMAEDASHQLVHGLAVVGIALYALAAVRYARMLWRRRVMLGIVTSYVLLAETLTTMFVTCVYAVLDPTTGRLRWANAGQDLQLLRSGGEVAELRATGMPLGLMPNMRYQEQVTLVPRGGSLLFHSDGLTE